MKLYAVDIHYIVRMLERDIAEYNSYIEKVEASAIKRVCKMRIERDEKLIHDLLNIARNAKRIEIVR